MAQFDQKHPAILKLMDTLGKAAGGAGINDQGLCPTCGKKVGSFRDFLSKKEFSISGMCQACQDSVFGTGEE